jgi:beta-hydroxylase
MYPKTEACNFKSKDSQWAYPNFAAAMASDNRDSNNSFNIKDWTAWLLIGLASATLIFMIAFVALLFKRKNMKDKATIAMLVLTIIFLVSVVLLCALLPISILQTVSLPMTMQLRTPPFLDLDENFPRYKDFEDPETFAKIQQEVRRAVTTHIDKIPMVYDNFGKLNSLIGREDTKESNGEGWRIISLKVGKMLEENCKNLQMDTLCNLVRDDDNIISVIVSSLGAKSHIPVHQGYYKGVIRYQLAIEVPEPDKAHLCVNGQEYHWKEGKSVLFDDMFLHSVRNDGEKRRIVLYLDVVRPGLSKFWDKYNKYWIDTVLNTPMIKKANAKQEKAFSTDVKHPFTHEPL